MKSTRLSIILLVAMLAAPAVMLYGQTHSMTITVPFKFTVTDTPMPAGEYFIKGVYQDAVAIQHSKGEAGVILMTQRSARRLGNGGKLTFHQYGGLYFLAEVQLPGAACVQTFATGKEEIEVAKLRNRQPDLEVGR